MLQVTIGGLTFEDHPRDYDQCYLIAPQGMTGWESGVQVRREEVARPNAHGTFDAPGFLAARVISVKGTILAPTPARLRHMVTRLTGVLGDGDTGRLLVEDDLGSTWADVRLAAATQVATHGSASTEADFQIQFWAADPRRFGELREFTGTTGGGAESVHHRGNARAVPILEITGTMPNGYQIASQGRVYEVSQALTSGQTHRIDMGTGWLYRNGSLQVGAVPTLETFTIPPGRNVNVTMSDFGGAGAWTMLLHDTFV